MVGDVIIPLWGTGCFAVGLLVGWHLRDKMPPSQSWWP